MHRQDGAAAPKHHPHMPAFCRLKARPLPFQPPLEFRTRHRLNIYVHLDRKQTESNGAAAPSGRLTYVGGWRSFLGETGSAQADIQRLRAKRHVGGVGVRGLSAEPCQRVDVRFALDRFGQSGPRVVDLALQAECPRKPKMIKPESSICSACLAEEVYCLIQMPQKEMGRAQREIISSHRWVMRVEPD